MFSIRKHFSYISQTHRKYQQVLIHHFAFWHILVYKTYKSKTHDMCEKKYENSLNIILSFCKIGTIKKYVIYFK